MQAHQNYIGGEWAAAPAAAPNRNPSNIADVVGEYARADEMQVRAGIAAARAALAALATLNESDGQTLPVGGDWRPLGTGIALHRGDVFFGNIGAPGRVDFTVIGAAVNLAARVEPLTKALGHPLLLTESVARLTQQPLVALGTFSLRGLKAPVAIYAPT